MQDPILNKKVQHYIHANLETDLHALLLKKTPFMEVSMQEIVQQIKGKKVAARRFPFLLKENIVFPPNLNLEQASSQTTAEFKAQNLKGGKFLDLTCGFGIDAFFLSADFEEVTLVEQNAELLNLVRHNWHVLERSGRFLNVALEEFLRHNTEKFDTVYLDPARRDQQGNKKFLLEDLSPNLLDIQDSLLEISGRVIIKLSPLIDISYLLSVLKNVSKIEVIAVRNEVKELVVYLGAGHAGSEPTLVCVNLESDDPAFTFRVHEERAATPVYGGPQRFLYLPNGAVLKSGAFNLIPERFGLKKLHPNTHLYTSDEGLELFPGRVLEVETVDAKRMKKGEKYNIISKNYPLSPDEIRKKYKLSAGGERYLIFTQSVAGKIILKSK